MSDAHLRQASALHQTAECERERLRTAIEELDLEQMVDDEAALPNQLVHPSETSPIGPATVHPFPDEPIGELLSLDSQAILEELSQKRRGNVNNNTPLRTWFVASVGWMTISAVPPSGRENGHARFARRPWTDQPPQYFGTTSSALPNAFTSQTVKKAR